MPPETQIVAREYLRRHVVIEERGHSSPCWIWQRCHSPKGYGRCHFKGQTTTTHQLAYRAFVGEIPEGLNIDHLCRVRGCCNPEHLEPVTNAENHRRARGFNLPSHCAKGHPLTDDNRLIYNKKGERRLAGCLTCHRARGRKSAAVFAARYPEKMRARHEAQNAKRRAARRQIRSRLPETGDDCRQIDILKRGQVCPWPADDRLNSTITHAGD